MKEKELLTDESAESIKETPNEIKYNIVSNLLEVKEIAEKKQVL